MAKYAFNAPTFTIKPAGRSQLPLFAPIEVTGNLRVAFNFLHQLQAGSTAAYRIEVEEAGRYAIRFASSPVEGAYQISTEYGAAVRLPSDTTGLLPLRKGKQMLTLRVLQPVPEDVLRSLELSRGNDYKR